MKHSPLARHAPWLTVAAGSLFAVTQLVMLSRIGKFDPGDPDWRQALLADPIYVTAGVVYFLSFCLLLLAIVAVYVRQAREPSAWWDIGAGAALVGIMNLGGNFWFEGFVTPWLAAVAPEALNQTPSGVFVLGAYLSYVLFSAGWVLFAIAGLRTHAFPGLIALAIVVGGLLGFIASPPFGVPLGLAIAWLGIWMLSSPIGHNLPEPATP